jgi:hypothetical protein
MKWIIARVTVLAVLLALVVIPAFQRPASAGALVPFHASFTTEFSSSVAFPLVHITVNGEGQALHMGRTEASTTNQVVNLITGVGTATYTLTAANGDTVRIEMAVHTEFPSSTSVTFSGTYEVTGGTGRFSGATGSGTIEGSANFTSASDGVGEFTLDGILSSVGSK